MSLTPPALTALTAISLFSAACQDQPEPRIEPVSPAAPAPAPAPATATVTATVTALSIPPNPADLSPYRESLVEFEYRIDTVRSGVFPHTVFRVAHWGVLGGKPSPTPTVADQQTLTLIPFNEIPGIANFHFTSDLDPLADLPLFLEQKAYDALRQTPSGRRFDYGQQEISARMEIYWLTRHQLKLAVTGNSHAGTGVRPGAFYPTENASHPVAISLAAAASSFEMQHSIATDYLLELPQLEWVVWCLSPRLFNSRFRSSPRDITFANSSGRTYDRENAADLWPLKSATLPVPAHTTEAVWNQRDAWGGSKNNGTSLDFPSESERRSHITKECYRREFRDNPDVWKNLDSFLAAAQRRSLHVFLFLPPTHPDTRHANCADPDGTGHADLETITSQLATLAARYPNTIFADYNQSGRHSFPPEQFYDIDHLNTTGADHLTAEIIRQLAKITPDVAR